MKSEIENKAINILTQMIDPQFGLIPSPGERFLNLEPLEEDGEHWRLYVNSDGLTLQHKSQIEKHFYSIGSEFRPYFKRKNNISPLSIINTKPYLKAETPKITLNDAQKVIAVSGSKGGVGKTFIGVNLAYSLASLGLKVGIFDLDFLSSSTNAWFLEKSTNEILANSDLHPGQIKEQIHEHQEFKEPEEITKLKDIRHFCFEDLSKENRHLGLKGPILSKTLRQLCTQIQWDKRDLVVIDLPCGFNDVSLSLMEEVKVDGVILIVVNDRLALKETIKEIFYYKAHKIPIIGVIENFIRPLYMYEDYETRDRVKFLCEKYSVDYLAGFEFSPLVLVALENSTPIAKFSEEFAEIFMSLAQKI